MNNSPIKTINSPKSSASERLSLVFGKIIFLIKSVGKRIKKKIRGERTETFSTLIPTNEAQVLE